MSKAKRSAPMSDLTLDVSDSDNEDAAAMRQGRLKSMYANIPSSSSRNITNDILSYDPRRGRKNQDNGDTFTSSMANGDIMPYDPRRGDDNKDDQKKLSQNRRFQSIMKRPPEISLEQMLQPSKQKHVEFEDQQGSSVPNSNNQMDTIRDLLENTYLSRYPPKDWAYQGSLVLRHRNGCFSVNTAFFNKSSRETVLDQEVYSFPISLTGLFAKYDRTKQAINVRDFIQEG